MDHSNKKQKVGDNCNAIYKEEVLFNSDTLSKIISYLPSVDLLNLALSCKRFGVSLSNEEGDYSLSLIKKSARIAIQALATEDQLAALPHYDGDSSLADYHYIQLLRQPLAFDQLIGAEYVDSGDKTCVRHTDAYPLDYSTWKTAFSNNIPRAGKHYTTFKINSFSLIGGMIAAGLMRPGQANESARGFPVEKKFFQNFSRTAEYCNSINDDSVECCLYNSYNGKCCISNWRDSDEAVAEWDGSEHASAGDELGLLLDLDEGTLSVYKNGRKLGLMKKGLAGPYCWVVSVLRGTSVTIKQGTIPSS